MAEWLRRWTANPMGIARPGSNPGLRESFAGLKKILFNGRPHKLQAPLLLLQHGLGAGVAWEDRGEGGGDADRDLPRQHGRARLTCLLIIYFSTTFIGHK